MNYIWDLVIKAGQSGIHKKNIEFSVAESYSPYMELSCEVLNIRKIEHEVEVNPYYRYYEIFKDMFNINNTEDKEFRDRLFDITAHFLADIDVMQGMNKSEYYLRFVRRDINNGLFGELVKEDFDLFNEEEKNILAENIIRLYLTGDALYLLKDSLRKIFRNSTIYANYETLDELLFFINCNKKDLYEKKLELINEIFLPVKFRTRVYWKDHFGVIEAEDTMMIDSIALY